LRADHAAVDDRWACLDSIMEKAMGLGRTSSVVLAGGRSLRLKRDKAFLDVRGQFLIERIVARLRELSEEIIIVARQVERYEELEAIVVSDVYPGKGSLGGIFSGLKKSSSFQSLVVACDMPFLNLSLLRYMRSIAAPYDVVMPRINGMTEALHAIYSKNCLPFMERQLQAADLRIIHFLPQVRVRYIEREEIDVFDPEHLSFFNINSQADLKKAREIWEQEA
jgi:molybdopterin-guanine dinucleotide biosynthesis protein A